jgi:hypothetical protein
MIPTKVNEGTLVITVLLMYILILLGCDAISLHMMHSSLESISPKRAISWPWKWKLYDPPSSQHLGPRCLRFRGQKTLTDCEKQGSTITQSVRNYSPNHTAPHSAWPESSPPSVSHLKSAYSTVSPNHEYCQHSVHQMWRYLPNAVLFCNTRHASSLPSTWILATIMFEYKNLLWCYTVLLSE